MIEIKLLEFGYSVEYQKHFIRLNILGMGTEKKNKMLSMIVNIPSGDIKRFVVESDDDNSLKILEYLPEKEYPFNKEVPTQEEIKSVEGIIKEFIIR